MLANIMEHQEWGEYSDMGSTRNIVDMINDNDDHIFIVILVFIQLNFHQCSCRCRNVVKLIKMFFLLKLIMKLPVINI